MTGVSRSGGSNLTPLEQGSAVTNEKKTTEHKLDRSDLAVWGRMKEALKAARSPSVYLQVVKFSDITLKDELKAEDKIEVKNQAAISSRHDIAKAFQKVAEGLRNDYTFGGDTIDKPRTKTAIKEIKAEYKELKKEKFGSLGPISSIGFGVMKFIAGSHLGTEGFIKSIEGFKAADKSFAKIESDVKAKDKKIAKEQKNAEKNNERGGNSYGETKSYIKV